MPSSANILDAEIDGWLAVRLPSEPLFVVAIDEDAAFVVATGDSSAVPQEPVFLAVRTTPAMFEVTRFHNRARADEVCRVVRSWYKVKATVVAFHDLPEIRLAALREVRAAVTS
jgi:hypothetical protein